MATEQLTEKDLADLAPLFAEYKRLTDPQQPELSEDAADAGMLGMWDLP